jgi:ABC-type Zn uptake system ZnuABC Zn-binding protein ZnuA
MRGITRRAAAAWVIAAASANAREHGPGICPTPLRVVATTSDLAALTAAVGGDFVQVRTVVPPLVDAETFEPSVRDLALIAGACLVVRVGLGCDSWLDKLLGRGRTALLPGPESVVDASSGIPLLEVRGRDPFARDTHGHGLANPHYWLDPGNAVTITANIGMAIAASGAVPAQAIADNRKLLLERLGRKMDEWRQRMAPYRGSALIAYHNTWPYFARRFHLNVVGFVEPKEGVTPSVAHLASLLSQARRMRVRAVLQTTNEPTRLPQRMAQSLGVPLVQLAPAVGSVPGADDYLGFMEHNVGTLVRALAASA